MTAHSAGVVTFLFSDIEGSTRLWEQEPQRMSVALARHDALAREAVTSHRGTIVKMSGDGVHAAFDDPADAIDATVELQKMLTDPDATGGIRLLVRCGLHAGVVEGRDNDFFGSVVNRAARIMSAAHGGQILVSQAVADLVRERLPEGSSLRDLGAVRLRDLSQPEQMHQLLHPQLRHEFPALRSLESVPNNLPRQLTSFVGREHQCAEVERMLSGTRLLTLVGPGGIGKTRLSLQVAAVVIDQFQDGVWFVDLAPLSDARLVPQAVASVLGVREEAGRPVSEALMNCVKDRQQLIILDNCEHLAQSCAEIAGQLLQSAPRLKLLASSREFLNVAGETCYPVPALSAPDPQLSLAPDAMAQYEAVRLFTDRARAAQPAFRVTRENSAAVADICSRLDGIPLAIELAAARVRALSVEAIAARLRDSFRLLAGGDRTALPRQQTLRALIDWSHDLLTNGERVLFRRLAVFSGGWTLEAAEAVCAGDGVADGDVLDLLTRLVEKSLVALEAGGNRYRLLDTVRHYAQERLDVAGDGDRVRNRHLACYLALAEAASPGLVGPEQGTWLARLDLERENLLSAHAWCGRADGGAEPGLRLVCSVKLYMIYRSLLALGHRVTLEALVRPGAQDRSLARCRALHCAGQFGFYMGRYSEARGYLDEALGIAREIGDTGRISGVLEALGMALVGLGDLVGARVHLEEALALERDLGDKRDLAVTITALAQLCRVEGDLDTAEPLYEEVLALARDLRDPQDIAVGLLNLAMLAIDRGSAERAQEMLLEAHAIAGDIGSRPAGQSVLEVSTGLAALRGDWERAAVFFGAAEAQTARTGLQREPADAAFLARPIEQARAALGADAFSVSERVGRSLSFDEAVAAAGAWLAVR